MNSEDSEKLTQAMQEFCKPEAQEKRLKDKWRDAGEACALHIQLDPPAPDGDFEILLIPRRDVDKMLNLFKNDKIDVISFAAGVALSREHDCCGGVHTFQEAITIASVNEDAQAQIQHMGL